MATKHGMVEAQREGIPPINSYNPLNMFSREIMRQINISPLCSPFGHKTYQGGNIPQGVPPINLHNPSTQ